MIFFDRIDLTSIFDDPPASLTVPHQRVVWKIYTLLIAPGILTTLFFHIALTLIIILYASSNKSEASFRKAWRKIRSPEHGGIWHAYPLFILANISLGMKKAIPPFVERVTGDKGYSNVSLFALWILEMHTTTALVRSVFLGRNLARGTIHQLLHVPYEAEMYAALVMGLLKLLNVFSLVVFSHWEKLTQWMIIMGSNTVLEAVAVHKQTRDLRNPNIKKTSTIQDPAGDVGIEQKQSDFGAVADVQIGAIVRIILFQRIFPYIWLIVNLLGRLGEGALMDVLKKYD